jgi:esterase/lipase superfamily enzyme
MAAISGADLAPPAAAGDWPREVSEPAASAPEFEPPTAAAEPPPPTSAPELSSPRAAGPPATASASVSAAAIAAAPPSRGAFEVVQVFYATDRKGIASANRIAQQVSRLLPTAISILITLALGLVAMAKRGSTMWILVGCGVVASLALGYQAASGTMTVVRRSDHSGPRYTSDRSPGGQVQLGLCEVTIPKSHQVGELEAPSILRLEVKDNADKHVVLRKTERLADERFYELLRERVAASPRRELFVFVHGFNVTFEDAARRTAQIQHDLKYEGAPIFFSWPAHDKFVLTYTADENNVTWSVSHLKKFLLDVTKHSQARSINLIAHSMGNRALASALKELQLELRDQSRLFNQVILAAPDIDADEFRQSIAPALTRTANRITLYASARDEALAASQLVHRGPRAGDAGRGLVVVPGIDTIDVTPIDTSLWGHTYYGSSDPVLRDLNLLITQAVPPEQRVWLAPAELAGQPYWIFQPGNDAMARGPGGDAR